MQEQDRYTIKQFIKKNAISRSHFYELKKNNEHFPKYSRIPGLAKRVFISAEEDQKWQDYLNGFNETESAHG